MRRSRTRSADEPADRTDLTDRSRIRANGWPVLPLRLFLAALFCFAGYAKFAYPRFFEPESPNGFRAAVNAAREGDTPLGGAMGPLADHASLFGHVTAYAEIAIGLGLLVGLLTRLAALGGIVLTLMIALSIAWNGIKEYTGSSGWFTSSELAIAAALTVFLLGGAGPLALDNLFIRARERQRARDDAEPSFRDSDIDDSRRRLQGEPRYGDVSREPVSREPVGAGAGAATAQLPAADRQAADR
ncbi:MAG TPA: DoxX family protein, partial [Jatrophihabitans sp.]